MTRFFLEDESPRFQLTGPRISPSLELARWLLESRGHTYQKLVNYSLTVPPKTWLQSLVTFRNPSTTVSGIDDFLVTLEGFTRPQDSLLTPPQPKIDVRDSIRNLETRILKPALQLFYYCLRDDHETMIRYAAPEIPRVLVKCGYWIWRSRLSKTYGLADFDPTECLRLLKEEFSKFAHSRSLQSNTKPDTIAIAFASMASILLLPDECDSWLPPVSNVAECYQKIVGEFRNLDAGKWVLDVYKSHRKSHILGPDLPPAEACPPPQKTSWLSQWIGKLIVKNGRLLLHFPKPLKVGKSVFVAHWSHIADALRRDNEFLVSPNTRCRIEEVSGPFMLGMDRSPDLLQQREWIYSAMRSADRRSFEAVVENESSRILSDAANRDCLIDIVNGYSRLVAARSAAQFFGIAGRSEPELVKVVRSIFQHTFLNVTGDQVVRQRGMESGKIFKEWIHDEIHKRRHAENFGKDFLGKLLSQKCALEDETIAWMLAGLFIGSIDTTSTVVCNIVSEALSDEVLLSAMREDAERKDINSSERFAGWCWEALRRRPNNPALVRVTRAETTLGGKVIPADTPVIMLIQAAMFDPKAFEYPDEMIPNRPWDRYLHFGRDLHQCSGRYLSEFQIPVLVRSLFKYKIERRTQMQMCGPLPDCLIVSLQ